MSVKCGLAQSDPIYFAIYFAAHQRVTGKKAKKTDMSSADKIKVIDTDGDGILTAEEHAAGSRAMFEKMDTDKDGFLTKDELAAGHAQMMKKPSR